MSNFFDAFLGGEIPNTHKSRHVTGVSRSIRTTERAANHPDQALGVSFASVLFAVALLASGQNSTLTGTLAGQVVMEGFLNIRIMPWLRRLITRGLAIIPAVLVIGIFGEGKTTQLLIASQVVLSMQLGFAVWPLLRFTDEKAKMGEFVNRLWLKILGWTTAAIIIVLNVKLLFDTFMPDAMLKEFYQFLHLPPPA
jgi:manganese transport protein